MNEYVLDTAMSSTGPSTEQVHTLPDPGRALAETARPFLDWLDRWFAALAPLPLAELTRRPERVALCSVDLINGFTYHGNLASPRVAGVLPAVVDLFTRAQAAGVRHFLMIQECHSELAEEFKAFGPHGICGTGEAEMVAELASLPFADQFTVFHKNSLHTIVGTGLENWLARHPEVDTFLVVGDCTDLCVFDLAMDLKLRANSADISRRIVVSENCVQTYDLPVAAADKIGALPHDGDFLHRLFLYQMGLNKIEVVRAIG